MFFVKIVFSNSLSDKELRNLRFDEERRKLLGMDFSTT
jgi:hypothetical protein